MLSHHAPTTNNITRQKRQIFIDSFGKSQSYDHEITKFSLMYQDNMLFPRSNCLVSIYHQKNNRKYIIGTQTQNKTQESLVCTPQNL